MSRRPRRLLPSTAGKTHVEQLNIDQFARRLHAAMNSKGMSNSDLAREVWGEITDSKGYKVARNRERIGAYLRGDSFPEPRILAKLAEALDTTSEDLAPDITASAIDRERPALSIVVVAGHEDKAHVVVNQLLPLGVAVEIQRLIERSQRKQPLVPGIDTEPEDQ